MSKFEVVPNVPGQLSEAATHGLRVTRAEIDLLVGDPMWASSLIEVNRAALRRWREAIDTAIDRAAAKDQS